MEVEVELVQGSVTGWLPMAVVPKRFRDDAGGGKTGSKDGPDEEAGVSRRNDDPADSEPQLRSNRRVKVPTDEGILLRREPTFFYGVQAGGGLAILDAGVVSANFFQGPAVYAGGHVGYFLSRAIPVRLEIQYNLMSGTEPTGKIAPINVGFLQTGLAISYLVDQFEIYGGISYGFGISVSNIDPKIKINSPMDFSSLYFGGGLGFSIPLSEISNLILRARYDISASSTPVGFQSISGLIYLEFRG